MRKFIIAIFIMSFSIFSFAGGSGNLGGSGGNYGQGNTNNLTNGADGIRIYVVSKATGNRLSMVKDYYGSAGHPTDKDLYFCGTLDNKKTKFDYKASGYSSGLSIEKGYVASTLLIKNNLAKEFVNNRNNPTPAMHQARINEIKNVFVSEINLCLILKDLGELAPNASIDEVLPYMEGKNDGIVKYLAIEPLAYYKILGRWVAMSATESAMLVSSLTGVQATTVESFLKRLVRMNLPLAMFLEHERLGIGAFSIQGNIDSRGIVHNYNIVKNLLGIGLIEYNDEPTTPPPPTVLTYDYVYRTDTRVISSITIESGDNEYTIDNPLEVEFSILGSTYTQKVVIPKNESQLVWVKWTTPSTPQSVTIEVRATGINKTINCNIIELKEKEPPETHARDTYKDFKSDFARAKYVKQAGVSRNEWSVWNCEWIPPVYQRDALGNIVYQEIPNPALKYLPPTFVFPPNFPYIIKVPVILVEGYYNWWVENYSMSIKIHNKILAGKRTFSATNMRKEMKSGYGIEQELWYEIDTNASNTNYSSVQKAISYFPEYLYKTYDRFLEFNNTTYNFEFKPNKYSHFKAPVHYTPIWYPDNMEYRVMTYVFDSWTPSGMLSVDTEDYVMINGNLFDDWHVKQYIIVL